MLPFTTQSGVDCNEVIGMVLASITGVEEYSNGAMDRAFS